MLIQKPICCSVNSAEQLIGYFVHSCKFILEINELDKNESSLKMDHDCSNLYVSPYKPHGQLSVCNISRDASIYRGLLPQKDRSQIFTGVYFSFDKQIR